MYALRTVSGTASSPKPLAADRQPVDLDRQALGGVVKGIASGLRDVLPVSEREPLPATFDPLIRRLTINPLDRRKAPSPRKAG
ncbi:hypothetical protein U8607_19745 [Methylobacterium durans]|uniref:hypothetical protein n=1 Tax=Methylobacterium durans TaxID=2202825 RepID=UPI002AFE47EF|nr:hypothetical protein [Methylobacterium durans]MEA1834332.1 hypothetical protein [Methylobacterium durans]